MKILVRAIAVWKRQPAKGSLNLPTLERHLLHMFTGCFVALVLTAWLSLPAAVLASWMFFTLIELFSVIVLGETIRNACADVVQYSFQWVVLNFIAIRNWETLACFVGWIVVYYLLLPKVEILTVEEE